ncbi:MULTISPECIES: chemotaxis protein CheA [Brevibacillus]|jgi:two-component system chemotaxis sensor kinase CheA|uniref:Chemotaxis protein CheA n=1 Tax=Brevibacillus borstelensis AK1 TaxID=1300222 RepID=M8EFE0_9BACL|nr:chemotaxis protein CheA [Brevibacillus borstelensis]EMT54170.1 chemotaxis protein CheA [Brevibacillus borstelensis AK1]KKX53995.1 chemotaxis protein CheA [Brevibacillus borstelensis cifa_chp40]MBE5398019.1 chemotaxis protein CheA [Brevibacillus borstelensis]MCM3557847.1 chemotaxis protein CheA [Brevibacillus borstelensis]MED1746383.1 chemotaxis protein CheA [Brevibacillus borstelensis]
MDMNQYLDMFIEESKEHLQAINANLLVLENDPESTQIVNEIFRSAHTLKGMSATMGFEDMASLTHEAENVLDLIRNDKLKINSDIMDVIFQSVDLIEGMVMNIMEGGDGSADVSQPVAKLRAIVSGDFSAIANVAAQEATASVEQVAAGGSEDGNREYDLDEFSLTVLKQSKEAGNNLFWIKVTLQENCLLKAARAYMVFDQLESMGEVIKSTPAVEDLENERFDLSFEVVFVTMEPLEKVKKAISNISEIEEVLVEPVEMKEAGKQAKQAEQQVAAAAAAPAEVKKAEGPAQNNTAVKKVTAGGKTIRVDIERLDVLMNLFSELVIDRGRLEQLARELGKSELQETVEHMSRISGDLQNIILTMRMVPVEQVFNRFPRMIRDLAKDLNKKVNLEIYGAETELDRTVIDEIGDPLVHLLRNSLDHGVESPAQRKQAGKPEEGTIQLRAFHSGNHVFIEVKDDGAGINKDKVLKKAIERGIVNPANADSLSDRQIFELLFSSGFSTAEVISDISGRGVGLDVVKTKIESLGGNVSVDSVRGQGTTFLIQLPLTLSIISAMLVQVQNEKYAVPLSSIIETAVFRKDQIMMAHRQKVIDFRGRVVPLVSLQEIFQIPDNGADKDDEVAVVIVRKGEKMAGLVVDSFIGQQEIVLKSLGKYLVNVFAISGATILGDGQVALIIDCNALIK